MNMKKTSPHPMTSFLSLPDDVVLNCLARISLIHRPTLSLVSKSFQSLLASHELKATESRMGITADDRLYVCLDLNKDKPNPRWFMLAPTPKQQRLVPLPSFPNPESSTVVSVGSEIYIIGGYLNKERCISVFIIDFRSFQWRSLPNMHVPRATPAAGVIEGKLYVIGGYSENSNTENWGEVYDTEKQTWETFSRVSPTGLFITNQQRVPRRLVMGGKLYENMFKLNYPKDICVVEIDKNVFCQIAVLCRSLHWRDEEEVCYGWRELDQVSPNSNFPKNIDWVTKSCGGRRVIVWWKEVKFRRTGGHLNKESKTEIWCAEIILERCGYEELRGIVEWSKNVFTLNGYETGFDFCLDYVIVSH